jgi:hypothetical protein
MDFELNNRIKGNLKKKLEIKFREGNWRKNLEKEIGDVFKRVLREI